jgi:hypothetical protein
VKSALPTRLSIEHLEDRLTPSWGTPWPSPTTLTISFAPDGTDISGVPSNLFSLLGPNTQAWETTILQAYQTWAVESNINLGLVPDGGEPFGTPGLLEGDPRFGDIRIGAIPLSSASSGMDLADTVGVDVASGTWSGDFLLNSNDQFNIGGTNGGYDLYSVALHEAGHSFGFPDNPSDPNSVLYPGYQIWKGLAPEDVATIQSLYGLRSADAFQGATGNSTLATAFNLTANGNLTAISADISNIGQAEYFQFTTPNSLSGTTGLNVNLQAAGISLLTSQLTVLNSAGNVVASTVTTNPLNNNLSISLPNYNPSTTYYVEVAGAGNNVFSVGSYDLQLNYTNGSGTSVSTGNSFGLGSAYVNSQTVSNNTLQTAQPLGFSSGTQSTSFSVVGALSKPTETDWYQITPTSQNTFTGTLTVGVVPLTQGTSGADAQVAVYSASGNELPFVVVSNQNGGFTVQLSNQMSGTTYYVSVSAANPSAANSVGGYMLSANLSQAAITSFDSVITTTLSSSESTVYSELTLAQGRVVELSLAASTQSSAPVEATGVTILDSNGNVIFTMAVEAGTPLSTGTVWLGVGTYVVVLTGATEDGSPLQNLNVMFSAREISDPMDPLYIDTNAGPPASLPPPPPPATASVSSPSTAISPPPASQQTTPPPASTPASTTSSSTVPAPTPSPPTTTPPASTPATSASWFIISSVTNQPPITIIDPIGNPFLELN